MSAALTDTPEPSPPRRDPLFLIGSLALLAAMAVDSIAVIGRHLGLNLIGSIELVQAAMLIASSTALVAATRAHKHPSVRLILDRLGPGPRRLLTRVHALLAVVFFTCLAVGSGWILHDLWGGHEQSELLHLPYLPLRMVCIAAVIAVIVLALRELTRGREP